MTLRTEHIPGNKPSPGERMTFEEFLEAEFDHHHYEWVDGEAIEMAEIELRHAELREWIATLIGLPVETRSLGKVLGRPFLMKSGENLPARAPDIMFISDSRRSQLERYFLRGPADLVIEIASPSTRSTDRNKKFREYEAGGVGEYWILDPERQTADFFTLEDGTFVPGEVDEKGIYRAKTFPELSFEVAWFWTQPPAIGILKQWSAI